MAAPICCIMYCFLLATRLFSSLSWEGRRILLPRNHQRNSVVLSAIFGNSNKQNEISNFNRDRFILSVASNTLESIRDDERQVILSETDLASLPNGNPKDFKVVHTYETFCDKPFEWSTIDVPNSDTGRLGLTPNNVSLPVALMIADSNQFPTLSRARKACRKDYILIHRGPLIDDELWSNSIRGRVVDRVYPGDTIGKQVRIGSGYFPVLSYKKPPFDLPVVFEDDHFSLVNKPAGVVVYQQGNGGHGIMTLRAALPFVLKPPRQGTFAILRRPASVHRLDKPTSGIICVAKTKPAMLDLSRQFHDRKVRKTYMAIINGIPEEESQNAITSREAYELGVDVDRDTDQKWQLIDSPLDDKHAVTIWRAVRYVRSLHANDGYLTLVEMKPKTGRYHQLRRHMAWVCQKPMVGDDEYDEGTESARKFRENGLFLCSTKVTLEHPYYNSEHGRKLWDSLDLDEKHANGLIYLSRSDKVMITAEISLPDKFHKLLSREESRFQKFNES